MTQDQQNPNNSKLNERKEYLLDVNNDPNKITLIEILTGKFKKRSNSAQNTKEQNTGKNELKTPTMVKQGKKRNRVVLLITLIVIVCIIVFLVLMQWVNTPNVNINFEINLGEIIGGILIGSGALLAGNAYAKKVNNPSSPTPPTERKE